MITIIYDKKGKDMSLQASHPQQPSLQWLR